MAELKIGKMTMGICATNCYFLYEEGKNQVIFVDPADKGDYIYETLRKNNLTVAGIFLTHAHFDHIWGAEELRKLSGAKIYAYEGEKELCEDAGKNVSARVGRACTIKPDVYLKDGETVTVAGISGKVLATPGHTKGSCCYYFEEAGILVSGDTLFLDSVGRTDFPTGSMSKLVHSVKEKLFLLPDEVKVYPGHGDSTTIGHEKQCNPFC